MTRKTNDKQLANLIILRGRRIQQNKLINELDLKINIKLKAVKWL